MKLLHYIVQNKITSKRNQNCNQTNKNGAIFSQINTHNDNGVPEQVTFLSMSEQEHPLHDRYRP